MNRAKRQQINREIVVLFDSLWEKLEQETKDIEIVWQQARNMACSEWIFNELFGTLEPVQIIPESTDLLNKNFSKLIEANSRQKYFLIEAFLPTLKKLGVGLNTEQKVVHAYWKEEFAKLDPELDNRFKSPQKKA